MTNQRRDDLTWTWTDEAPHRATYSLLPIARGFAGQGGLRIGIRDISLAARIRAVCSDLLPEQHRHDDHLAELGGIAATPEAAIIKLPNISASIPQLEDAIAELRAAGIMVPEYNDDTAAFYKAVLGSAVNPVLRQGNSDRRVPGPVKSFAKGNPHRLKPWNPNSQTRVATMGDGDFYAHERSATVSTAGTMRIEFYPFGSEMRLLKEVEVEVGDVIDATFMSAAKLRAFLLAEIQNAKDAGVLFSIHMKATMMKVSDPIIFGHAVRALLAPVFEEHGQTLSDAGFNPNDGLQSLFDTITEMGEDGRSIEVAIKAAIEAGPELAMVDSDNGVTGLHAPNHFIIDASLPSVFKEGGQMWGPDGKLKDAVLVVPDRTYGRMYGAFVDDCICNGAFDVTTVGNVPNVGLMAYKAQEYGSHPMTFEIEAAGVIKVILPGGQTIEHSVEAGDIWRACRTMDIAIQDWVKLAVERARDSDTPAIFWLDEQRPHDRELITKVRRYLNAHDTSDLDITIMAPVDAMNHTLARFRNGKDTISVTGNVLRDYLTDLFPIMEVNTSAKMLSRVPLLAGGVLLETGAGGSAPKHVQQLVAEGHLRWDSIGEFIALAAGFEHLERRDENAKAGVLGRTLNVAIERVLSENKNPSRKARELDNRGSHFYLALYWAEALATQDEDAELKAYFTDFHAQLAAAESAIIEEIRAAQGEPVDFGGYYNPDPELTEAAMRPSKTFNGLVDQLVC